MLWRYLFLSLLLVVPRSQIVTFASVELEKKAEDSFNDAGVVGVDGINLDSQPKDEGDPPPAAAPSQDTPKDEVHAPPGNAAPQVQHPHKGKGSESRNFFGSKNNEKFILMVTVVSAAGFIGIIMAGVCYYKFRRSHKAATEVDYPAYGVTGPTKERIPSPGDRKLAQSAQMYHYQHQKQQMIAMEKANGDMKHDASDDDSEEDNVEGDYTVYECPGLAPTGEMEVKNPLFRGDETPVNPDQDMMSPPHGNSSPNHEEEH